MKKQSINGGVKVLAALIACMMCVSARADFTFNISQSGSNVVGSGSGSFNLSSLTLFSAGSGGNTGYIDPSGFVASGGSADTTDWYQGYTVPGNPSNFGTGGGISADSNSTNGFFVLIPGLITGDTAILEVAGGYVSGASFDVSSVWSNTTISGLGLTPGSFTWQWSATSGGGATDSVTVNIAGVPEPSTYALFGLGSLLVFVAYRRKAA